MNDSTSHDSQPARVHISPPAKSADLNSNSSPSTTPSGAKTAANLESESAAIYKLIMSDPRGRGRVAFLVGESRWAAAVFRMKLNQDTRHFFRSVQSYCGLFVCFRMCVCVFIRFSSIFWTRRRHFGPFVFSSF